MSYFQQNRQMALEGSEKVDESFTRAAQERERVSKENKMSQILSDIAASKDPQGEMNNFMSRILTDAPKESQPALLQYIEGVGQKLDAKKKRESQIASGYNPDLPESINKLFFEQSMGKGKELKLNEELNQQKSRTKSKVEDIVRPYGMMDPFTRMITWNRDTSASVRDKINKEIAAERKKSFSTQQSLYKRYGQDVPEDLMDQVDVMIEKNDTDKKEGIDPEKVAEAYRLLTGK